MSNSGLMPRPHHCLGAVVSSKKYLAKLDIKPRVVKGYVNIASTEERRASYKILLMVVLLHVVGLVCILHTIPEAVRFEKSQAPMLVSLLSPIDNTPEEKTLPTVEPNLAVKKQVDKAKNVIEKPREINDVATGIVEQKQLEKAKLADAPVNAETILVEKQGPEESMDVEHVQVEMKAEPEAAIEPPSFDADYLNNPAPVYPMLARRIGEQGRVLLKVLVLESGKAHSVEIDKSSGHRQLDKAAIEAVKQWKFIPAKRRSQLISAYVIVPISFSLDS